MKHLIEKEVVDEDGALCKVVDATSNSVNVFIAAKTEAGISCTNWFDEKSFYKRFKGVGME